MLKIVQCLMVPRGPPSRGFLFVVGQIEEAEAVCLSLWQGGLHGERDYYWLTSECTACSDTQAGPVSCHLCDRVTPAQAQVLVHGQL
jgi:hypothetical protein